MQLLEWQFSEFPGQAGCLFWLGDVLKAPWVCSQDVRSPGSIQGTSSLHWPFLREPTPSPMAKGSRMPPVNWGSMVVGAHSPTPPLSLIWKEGWCVLNTNNTSVAQDLPPCTQPSTPLPSYSPEGHSKATWMSHAASCLAAISRITRIALAPVQVPMQPTLRWLV